MVNPKRQSPTGAKVRLADQPNPAKVVKVYDTSTGREVSRMADGVAREMFRAGKLDWDPEHQSYCLPRKKK